MGAAPAKNFRPYHLGTPQISAITKRVFLVSPMLGKGPLPKSATAGRKTIAFGQVDRFFLDRVMLKVTFVVFLLHLFPAPGAQP